MGTKILAGMVVLMMFGAGSILAQTDTIKTSVPDSNEVSAGIGSQQVIAYYFHGERRCATCQKLEAYSKEAIESGFAQQLEDSSLIWRVVNFEEADHEHFAKDYGLYSQAVILSRVSDGDELQWINLDKIWTLVGDKEKFVAYVQAETTRFLDGSEE